MTLLIVIPARLASTRLPRKPLRLLGGVPLVVRVFQRVASFGIGADCVVATDSEEVMQVCRHYHVPSVLSDVAHPSGTDRVAEVARRAEFLRHDAILNVQGDEPFVSREAIVAATLPVLNGVTDVGTVAVQVGEGVLENADVVKVVHGNDRRALYFSRAPIPFLRDKADGHVREGLVKQHLGVYAYTRAALLRWVALPPHPLELIERLEQLRPLAHGMHITVAEVSVAPERGIDTEEDLVRANAHWPIFDAAIPSRTYTTPIPSTA